MAIWQYNFTVIPKNFSLEENFDLAEYYDQDGFLDDESCWLKEPIEVNIFNEIENILPKNKSWNNDIILFGNQDSNRFEVYMNEDKNVVSVSFRIDYTTEYEEILRQIIGFIEMNNFIILDEDMELVPNNYLIMESLIENSDQKAKYDKMNG